MDAKKVEEIAYHENLPGLMAYVRRYQSGGCSWDEAMEGAAIYLARALKDANERLVGYAMRYGAPPNIVPEAPTQPPHGIESSGGSFSPDAP